MKSKFLGLLAMWVVAGPLTGRAEMIITIERLGDTSARITGSGMPEDKFGPYSHLFAIGDLFRKKDPLQDSVALFWPETGGNLGIGNCGVEVLVGQDFPTFGDELNFAWLSTCEFNDDSGISGESTYFGSAQEIDLLWEQIGSSGRLYAAIPGDRIDVGSWSIVSPRAVPEPGTLALLGLGLAGLSVSRARKSHVAGGFS